MAKKSFKNSARESVASAFFGSVEAEGIVEEKEKKDTKNTKNTKDTIDTKSVLNTRDTESLKPKREEKGDYRINLKLKGEFKEYLSDVAWKNRTSITNYLNDLIEKDMKEKGKRNVEL